MRAAGWLGRLGLLLGGLVAAALLLEAGLRLGSWVVWASEHGTRARAEWTGDGRRVLCLGDSNTYGLGVRSEDAYPAQLETLWNERAAPPQIEVMNLGYPGTNSSRVATQIADLLEAFAPDTVLVMLGVNDFWTRPVRPGQGAADSRPEGAAVRALAESRVARLFALLKARLIPDPATERLDARVVKHDGGRLLVGRYGDLEFELGFDRAASGSESGTPRELRSNLDEIVRAARAAGAIPVLLTYPAHENWHVLANARIRAAARAGRAQLVDLEPVFAQHCPDGPCDLLLDDGHPTADGYRRVAELLVEARAPLPRGRLTGSASRGRPTPSRAGGTSGSSRSRSSEAR